MSVRSNREIRVRGSMNQEQSSTAKEDRDSLKLDVDMDPRPETRLQSPPPPWIDHWTNIGRKVRLNLRSNVRNLIDLRISVL